MAMRSLEVLDRNGVRSAPMPTAARSASSPVAGFVGAARDPLDRARLPERAGIRHPQAVRAPRGEQHLGQPGPRAAAAQRGSTPSRSSRDSSPTRSAYRVSCSAAPCCPDCSRPIGRRTQQRHHGAPPTESSSASIVGTPHALALSWVAIYAASDRSPTDPASRPSNPIQALWDTIGAAGDPRCETTRITSRWSRVILLVVAALADPPDRLRPGSDWW